ncbi:MAG TPA: response regulator [Candidatus Limnocylindrales bacterium]|nr:response regulator [Candidatus Limnocylindrales bacterium]
MSAHAAARLRHALRTPLNHIIGYAEMVEEDAKDRSAAILAAIVYEVRGIARRIMDAVNEGLPTDGDVAPAALDALRAALRPMLQEISDALNRFAGKSAGAFETDLQKIRNATADLELFASGGDLLDPESASGTADAAAAGAHAGARILVVDDDQSNREILCRRLAREGFATASETGGEAALARLKQEKFDLVLLDLVMPEMDGFEVLARLRSDPAFRDLPVVVLSAMDDLQNAVRSIEMGAEDFLAKPVDPVLLRARIGAIVKRRKAEAERSEIADSLQLLLESTGEGIFGGDRDGRCSFVNRAAVEMLGYAREQMLGKRIHPLVHHSRPDGAAYPEGDCPILSVVRTGKPHRGAGEVLFRADGSSFPVEFSSYPILRSGEVEGMVVTFADISERKRTEDHLLQSAKLESLGVLAGGLAHDFNNILTGILGNASLVLESIPRSDSNHELLQEVVNASERAADLTRQMLAFAGKGRFVIEPVDLSRAIEDISELMDTSLPKPVRLSMELARDLPLVDADLRQLQQMVFNLVINAGEAIGERPGLVVVETGTRELTQAKRAAPFDDLQPGLYAYAAVQDTGTGMDAQTLSRIFDPFFTTKFTGRGLGLPAAMGIARSHHGAIQVESEAGRGSRFEVLLPAKAAPASKPAGGVAAATAAPERGRTILVVDDEDIVRRTTRAVLERKGYQVILAENGQQAIEIFRERNTEISLILLDVTMPVMGGEEAARHLHTIRHDVPILVSSGYNESEVARRFVGRRVAGYVRKPYTSSALLAKIGGALGAAE